jgi:hypothetical protein
MSPHDIAPQGGRNGEGPGVQARPDATTNATDQECTPDTVNEPPKSWGSSDSRGTPGGGRQ